MKLLLKFRRDELCTIVSVIALDVYLGEYASVLTKDHVDYKLTPCEWRYGFSLTLMGCNLTLALRKRVDVPGWGDHDHD